MTPAKGESPAKPDESTGKRKQKGETERKLNPQERFHNREWSWLRFNERVLEEGEDPANPLLERAKFLAIFDSNLDEFFMVRAGGIYRQLDAGVEVSGIDKRTPREQLDGIGNIVHELIPRRERALEALWQELAGQGVRLLEYEQLGPEDQSYLDRYYAEELYPVITPMLVDSAHPFPTLQSCTLHLVLRLTRAKKKGSTKHIAFVGLPQVLPRFVPVRTDDQGVDLVPMESILAAHMPRMFAGYKIRAMSLIRITRNADILIDEDTAEDFREAMAKMLQGRRHGAAVRLEYGAGMEKKLLRDLSKRLELTADSVQYYGYSGLIQAGDLLELPGLVDRPDLLFSPMRPLPLSGNYTEDIFRWLQAGPRLLYHPYHAFDPVAELARQAADDPGVLAIKQTFYRTSGDSPVVRALTRAARRGKHVTAVVEVRARFEEERNIEWAKKLEQAGAHVVLGLVGYKIHCKAMLVVRREAGGIRRYVHFGSGNYNDATARLYTDSGIMSCDEELGEDASALFNMITGATRPPDWNLVEAAPTGLRRRLLRLIQREESLSVKGRPGRIVAKMNSLQDRKVIDALYAASRAGVKVDLIVRGICCLKPGVAGLSENIRVVSIVGRFLEHARVLFCKNGGKPELYISSADWMPRNLDHRVELMVPVTDPTHRRYMLKVMELQLKDTVKARELGADGRWSRVVSAKGKRSAHSQEAIYQYTMKQLTREAGARDRPGAKGFEPIKN